MANPGNDAPKVRTLAVSRIRFRDPVWKGEGPHENATQWSAHADAPSVRGEPAKSVDLVVTPVGIECFVGVLVPWTNVICVKLASE